MIALSLLPLSLPLPCPSRTQTSPPHNHHLSNSILFSNLSSSVARNPPNSRNNRTPLVVVLGSNSSDPPKESIFFDENGAVDDMDGYLNHLSLEYDSVWDTKPSWCQPWTITLTGVLVTAGSWLIFHSVVFTAVVFTVISAWWYIFLYSYPKAYSEMIMERRERVTNGVEDTFGSRKNQ